MSTRFRVFCVALPLIALLLGATSAWTQALPNLNSLRVRYNTQKTTTKPDGELKAQIDTLDKEIGDAFLRVEFPGRKHSTLTAHRQQEGVDRVLAFFREKLLVRTA